jgi:hypothetical protein
VLRGRLEPEVGALFMKALAAARETLYQRGRGERAVTRFNDPSADPSAERPTMAQQQADALALLAEAALDHGLDPGAPGERYQVVVHVDAAALADPEQPGQSVLEGGARVPAETSQRLACDASRIVMRHDEDGRTVEVGARTRTIPPALRRALHHRDQGCRFPGCRLPFGQAITSIIGRTGAQPRSRTSRCSVAGTIALCTRRAIRSIDSPTARFSSGDRTASCSPTSRPRPRCPPIRSRRSGRSTTRRGSACTRGPRAHPGWASDLIWVTRSTSCIRWRTDSRDHPRERVASLRMDDRLRRQTACVTSIDRRLAMRATFNLYGKLAR